MKTDIIKKLKIPPESYFFRNEYDDKIQFRTNRHEWMPIALNLSNHGKRLIATCACGEWIVVLVKYEQEYFNTKPTELRTLKHKINGAKRQIYYWKKWGNLT